MATKEVEPLLRDAEAPPLSAATHKTILGTEVVQDDEDWQYCIVFNRVMEKDEVVQQPMEILKDIFTERVLDSWPDTSPPFWDQASQDSMDKQVLVDNIWNKVTEILMGKSCGFTLGFKPTADKEKIMLLFKLDDMNTLKRLAERMEMKVPLTPDAYTVKGLVCPTVAPTFGQRLGLNPKPPQKAPLFMRYDVETAASFKASTQHRVRKAKEKVDVILSGWDDTNDNTRAHIRRLMRLEDIRSAAFAMLVEEMNEYELSKNQIEYDKRKAMFTEMNVWFEKENKRLANSMADLASDAERFQARKRRWSPPEYLSVEDFKNVELYEAFTPLSVLRLVKHRIANFMDLSALEKYGFVDAVFTVHHKKETESMSESWGSLHPAAFLQWPGTQLDEEIRQYFGEEVAFFFNWLSYMTRMLVFPALLSIINLSASSLLGERASLEVHNVSAVLICAWVSYLSASYARICSTNNILWGMTGYNDKGMQRPSYEPQERGSLKESLIRSGHWVLVFLFLTQTIWSAYKISQFRSYALEHKKETMTLPFGFQLPFAIASKIGLYLVTINIKVMNFAWSSISPKVAERENWRTDQKMKNAQVSKTFLVKCVVYYYPFFYLAFIREHVEGCEDNACVHELTSNLAVFIITHIFTVIANVLVQIALTWWAEYKLKKKLEEVPEEDRKISYVEAQAMRPAYGGDTDDYMELSIALGFISMFSVVFPLCAAMALLTNLVELRVLAFRMLRVVRRPLPRGQEGIGAWQGIMKMLTYLSCITSVGLVIFTMKPVRLNDMSTKVFYFLFAEHCMVGLVYMLDNFIPERSVSHELIVEAHDAAESKIFAADSAPMRADTGSLKCLKPGCDHVTPGNVPAPKS